MPREIETKELIKFHIVDYNNHVDSKADHWYIKQGDRTLGPVDRVYVEKCLLSGELQFSDYVSEGGKPWKMIRDVAALEPVLREIEVRGPQAPAEVPTESKSAGSKVSSPFIIGNAVPTESGMEPVSQAKSNLELDLPPPSTAPTVLEKIPQKNKDVATEKAGENEAGAPKGYIGGTSEKLELDLEQYGRRPRQLQQGEVRLAPHLVNRKSSRRARRRRRKIKKVLRFVGALIVIALGYLVTKYLNEK